MPIRGPEHGGNFRVPFTPAVGQVVTFTASAAGTEPFTFTWDLGDGSPATGPVVTHTYAVTGTYTALMTVTNPCGEEEISHTVQVVLTPTCTPVEIIKDAKKIKNSLRPFTSFRAGSLRSLR